MIKSINPTNEELLKDYEEMSLEEINEIVDSVNNDFLQWQKPDFNMRSSKMNKAASLLRNKKEELSTLMTLEMGKPVAQSRAEVEKCAWVCDYFAENTERFLQDEIIQTDASKSFVTFQPLGVVLAVMPWNFPFWQVFRFAAPNLMASSKITT